MPRNNPSQTQNFCANLRRLFFREKTLSNLVQPSQVQRSKLILSTFKSLPINCCMRKYGRNDFFLKTIQESFRQDSRLHLPQTGDSHLSSLCAVPPRSSSPLSKRPPCQLSSQSPIRLSSLWQNAQQSQQFQLQKYQVTQIGTS